MIHKDFERSVELVHERMGVTREEILSRSKTENIKNGRQMVYWLMRLRGHKQSRVAQIVGRDHPTIAHGGKMINEKLDVDPKFKELWPECAGRKVQERIPRVKKMEPVK